MRRLLYFPEPYPDEDFRSIIYRYHMRSSNESPRNTNLELFGKNSVRLFRVYPTKMKTLFEKLPYFHSYVLDELILNHTWAGLLQAFMSIKKRKEFFGIITDGIENNSSNNSYLPFNFFSKTIKYCPLCMEEDFKNYGECYVHRKHQLNFMDFCNKHSVKLIDKRINRDFNGLTSVPFSFRNNNEHRNYELVEVIGEKQLKIEIFNLICYINENFPVLNLEKIYHKILMGLWEKNFIHYKGRILKKELISSLIFHYGPELLEALNIDSNRIQKKIFFKKIFGEDLNQDIIFYSLVILYLFDSIDKFIDAEITIANPIPFGSGPWKCFNKICEGYDKSVISKTKRSPTKPSVRLLISGEFNCPICGQVYAKVFASDKTNGNKIIIKTMGEMWINKVLSLYLMGHSVRQIALQLECSECAVRNNLERIIGDSRVLKEGNKEIVKQIIYAYMETASTKEINKKRDGYRNRILDIIGMDHSLKRSEIHNIATTEYLWLQKNDEKWLESILPPLKRTGGGRLDFYSFDKKLAKKIQKVSEELYIEYPLQIKKTSIFNKLTSIERNRLRLYPKRLPLSSKELSENIEPLNSYLVRKLPFVVESLLRYGYKNISIEKIKNVFKIYKKMDSKTETIIKKSLNDMGYYV